MKNRNRYLLTPKYEKIVQARRTYTACDSNFTSLTVIFYYSSIEIILECYETIENDVEINDDVLGVNVYKYLIKKYPDCYCGITLKNYCGVDFPDNIEDEWHEKWIEEVKANPDYNMCNHYWVDNSHWDSSCRMHVPQTWVFTPFTVLAVEKPPPPLPPPPVKKVEPQVPFEYAPTEPLEELQWDNIQFV